MKKGAKISLIVVIAILLVACSGAYLFNRVAKAPAIEPSAPQEARYIYVYPESTWDQVIDSLTANISLKHSNDVRLLLKNLSKTPTPKEGAYLIKPESTTLEIFKMLSFGYQSPVRLVTPSVRLPRQMWARIATQVMIDSTEIARAMTDTVLLREIGVTDSTLAYHIIPNTYEVYWSLSGEKLVRRLKKEWDHFWSDERRAKAEKIGLTPEQVTILASIVEEESAKTDEYPLIAGLYLNRLRIGMPLQADPTVKYAIGDFGLRRIRREHLQVESPYNTYKYAGLPPTPIRIPSQAGIEGVLSAKKHDFLYMCAKSDFSGYHDFAVNYAEHLRNARRYAKALDERGIK